MKSPLPLLPDNSSPLVSMAMTVKLLLPIYSFMLVFHPDASQVLLRLCQTGSKKERSGQYWGFYATCGVTVGSYSWSVTAWPQTCQWVEPGLETARIRRTPAKACVNELGWRMVSRNHHNMSGVPHSFP